MEGMRDRDMALEGGAEWQRICACVCMGGGGGAPIVTFSTSFDAERAAAVRGSNQ